MEQDLNEQWLSRYEEEGARMRHQWLQMLGPAPIMPREIMMPVPGTKGQWNEEVCNSQQYFRTIEKYAPRCDVKVGWSPSNQYEVGEMTWAFGDLDETDLETALVKARRYEEHCMSDFGVQPPALFTAGKGFHMHVRHDPVPSGRPYADAMRVLLDGSGVTLDVAPLKHRFAKPRVPYSLNLKATGKHRRPMYVVPVDLAWDLDEILRASAEIRITDFEIPHSRELADLLRPLVEEGRQKAMELSKTPMKKAQRQDLVLTAIAFCEDDGKRLVDARGRPDGRRRLLQSMYIPALMDHHDGDADQVMAAVEAWVEETGGRWRDYRHFVKDCAKRCVQNDGTVRSPIGLKRWFAENPDLRIEPSIETG